MLLYDYTSRKREKFIKMMDVAQNKGVEAVPAASLKTTFCGYCMLLALKIHIKKGGSKHAGTV